MLDNALYKMFLRECNSVGRISNANNKRNKVKSFELTKTNKEINNK